MNTRRAITTSAIALGVLAGSAGIAAAVSSQGSTAQEAPTTGTTEDEVPDPMPSGSIQAPDVEGQSEAEESAALESLATISADDAAQAALVANPGATVNGVELENEDGSVVYEVDVADSAGTTLEVKIDAGNGAVLTQESGDEAEGPEDEADEADEGHEDEADEGPEDEADEANETPEVAPGS